MVKNKIKLIYALFCVIIFNHRNRSGSGTFRSFQTYRTVLSKSKGNHMGGNMGRKDKVLKDYFELSAKIKEMHSEVILLKEQLAESLSLQCKNRECGGRR